MGVKKNRVINGVLGLLIILSFYLSFSLWTTGRNIGEEESENGRGSSICVSLTSHDKEDVFRPQYLALHDLEAEEPLLVTRSYEIRDFLKESQEKANLSEIEQVGSLTGEEYLEQLQSGQWLEFIYPEEIPFGTVSQKFIDMSSDKAQLFFDRVILDLANTGIVYFYHSASESFYNSVRVIDEEVNLDSLIDNDELTYFPAEPIFLSNQLRYLPTDSLEIYYRTYVIHQLPNSSYISNFFPDTSLVDVRSNNGTTRYIDLTKEVTMNETNHTLTYLRQIYTADQMSPEDRYTRSFQQINQFENWADTFILSAYNRENQKLSFRREIEGIPVFSNNDDESISEVSLVEEGVTHLKIPLRYANTPINIKGSPRKTLISGVEMIEELREVLTEQEFKLIENIDVGYSWEESTEESQVINFNPNWYILYNNRWVALSSLVETSKETVYGF